VVGKSRGRSGANLKIVSVVHPTSGNDRVCGDGGEASDRSLTQSLKAGHN